MCQVKFYAMFFKQQLLLIIIMVYIALFVLTAELIHSGPNDSHTI